MQRLPHDVEIDGVCRGFWSNSGRKGMFLLSRFADIDLVVRIVACALSVSPVTLLQTNGGIDRCVG